MLTLSKILAQFFFGLRRRGHRELIWESMHPDWLDFVLIECSFKLEEEYSDHVERAKTEVYFGVKFE